MFSSSLRRAARPASALTVRPCTSTSNHATFTTRSHQRRNSSSKPPIPPNNGSPSIPATSVKQVGAPRSTGKQAVPDARQSKRKVAKGEKTEPAKQKDDNYNEWTRTLPSVPSTQHLNPKDVYVASFFSTHRPISITGPLPPETSPEDIEKIFAVRPKNQKHKTQDIIYTLSSAVQHIEEQASSPTTHPQSATQHDESVAQRADLIKALTQHNNTAANTADPQQVQHLDGQPQAGLRVPGNVKIAIQALARQFRPFNPPPAPRPAPEVEFFEPETSPETATTMSTLPPLEFELQPEVIEKSAIATAQTMQKDTDNTFFTPSYNSHGRSRRGLTLARHLQQILEIRRTGQIKRMELISVKRQRRLKMKKHKYKKLQRKTRNLRRRQGKI